MPKNMKTILLAMLELVVVLVVLGLTVMRGLTQTKMKTTSRRHIMG